MFLLATVFSKFTGYNMDVTALGSLLATSEIGIGALLHAFRVPFTGHLLSLNQIFILNLALRQHDIKQDPGRLISITHIATAAKAITPAYKKITPIIALYAQTFLLYAPYVALGKTLAGQILGCLLSTLWAFIQGMISLYIVFGSALLSGVTTLSYLKLSPFYIAVIIGLLIVGKMALACATISIANYISPQQLDAYTKTISKASLRKTQDQASRQSAFSDLCRLSFFVPLILCGLGLWLQGSTYEEMLLYAARAIAATFLISLIAKRLLPPLLKHLN